MNIPQYTIHEKREVKMVYFIMSGIYLFIMIWSLANNNEEKK